MAHLLIVNPKRRKRHGRRKGVVPAHLRPFLFKKGHRGGKHASRRKRRSRRHNPGNPHRRRSMTRHVRRHYFRRRRRNPVGMRYLSGGVIAPVVGAAKGAVGALLVDALMTYVPLPDMLKVNPIGSQATRAVSAFLLGWLSSFVVGRSFAGKMTEGALTVQLYGLTKPLVSAVVPLSGVDNEMGWYNPGYVMGSEGHLQPGMGAYLLPAGVGAAPGTGAAYKTLAGAGADNVLYGAGGGGVFDPTIGEYIE